MAEVCTIVVILKVSEVPDFDGFEVWNLVAVSMDFDGSENGCGFEGLGISGF